METTKKELWDYSKEQLEATIRIMSYNTKISSGSHDFMFTQVYEVLKAGGVFEKHPEFDIIMSTTDGIATMKALCMTVIGELHDAQLQMLSKAVEDPEAFKSRMQAMARIVNLNKEKDGK